MDRGVKGGHDASFLSAVHLKSGLFQAASDLNSEARWHSVRLLRRLHGTGGSDRGTYGGG
jgi:hypothetical protein